MLDSRLTEYSDAIQVASKEVDCVEAPDPCLEVEERSTEDVENTGLIFMYRSKVGPIFTPKNLQTLCKARPLPPRTARKRELCVETSLDTQIRVAFLEGQGSAGERPEVWSEGRSETR